MNKKLLQGLLMMALFLPFLGNTWAAKAQTDTVVRIAPQLVTVDPGETFSVDVVVENVVDLWGFDVSVKYDPAFLSVESVELGDFLVAGFGFYSIDEVAGIINYVNAQTSGEEKSGSGFLFSIHFKAGVIDSQSQLEILEPDGMLLLSNINGEEIPCTVEHGTVEIGVVPENKFYLYLPLVVR